MKNKQLIQLMLVVTLLVTSFAATSRAQAITQCSSTVIVEWGDTLSGIAATCGLTIDAIRAANPGLGWWLYAGQALNLPIGSSAPTSPISNSTYVVQAGDTLKNIAFRAGVTLESILAANPQIVNMNLIYVGQVINMPKSGAPAPVTSTPMPVPTGAPGTGATPTPRPTFQPSSLAYGPVKVIYRHGLYIRNAPNGTIIGSAAYGDILYSRPGSDVIDDKGWVWVEVRMYPPAQGYYSGWILVRDQYGYVFTKPRFRPLHNLPK